MTIYRSLRNIIFRNLKNNSATAARGKARNFLTATTGGTTTTTPLPIFPIYFSPSSPSPPLPRFLSPVSKWVAPFQGPLFLSSPPWKLSQSATPLYLRVNRSGVVLKRVQALNLLRDRVGGSAGWTGLRPAAAVFDRIASESQAAVVGKKVGGEGMFKDGFLDSYVNLPNFISVSRLVSGPVLGWMITNQMYSSAFAGLAVAGVSDWLDGYVARKMNINSVVGSYLDPLADKVLIGSVALSMVHMGLLHPALVGLVVFRDIALVGGAVYHRASSLGWKWNSWHDFVNLNGTHAETVKPLYISKVNTVFQLGLVAAALLQPSFGTAWTQSCITCLSWLVASTTVASTAAYGAKYMRNRSALLAMKR